MPLSFVSDQTFNENSTEESQMDLRSSLLGMGFTEYPDEDGGYLYGPISVFDGGRFIAVESKTAGLSASFAFPEMPDGGQLIPVVDCVASMKNSFVAIHSGGENNECSEREEV